MNARLRAIGGGRIGRRLLWYRVRYPLALAVVFGCFLLVSYFDYQDAINLERARAERAEEQIRRDARVMKMVDSLPRTVFLLEGRTPEEAANKLLDIAADADGKRATILGETQFKK